MPDRQLSRPTFDEDEDKWPRQLPSHSHVSGRRLDIFERQHDRDWASSSVSVASDNALTCFVPVADAHHRDGEML